MRPAFPHSPRALATVLAVIACASVTGSAAHAAGAEGSRRWIALGALGGSTLLDAGLADYRWDVTPRGTWGAQALAGAGPLALGARLTRTATTQRLGVDGAPVAAAVRATGLEAVGQLGLVTIAHAELFGSASAGRLHLGYHPDRLTVPSSVAGAPVAVELAPVDAWTFGAGLGLRHPLAGPWALGLEVGHRGYAWEAAHRAGDRIEVRRETFGEWNAHLELAWTAGRR